MRSHWHGLAHIPTFPDAPACPASTDSPTPPFSFSSKKLTVVERRSSFSFLSFHERDRHMLFLGALLEFFLLQPLPSFLFQKQTTTTMPLFHSPAFSFQFASTAHSFS